jgi:hypothetical protein
MKAMIRLSGALALATIVGCGGDDKSGSSASAGAGGVSGGAASTAAGRAGAGGAGSACNPIIEAVAGPLQLSCPLVELCVASLCATQVVQCFGAGYATFDYSGGQCQAYVTCVAGCNCNQACVAACPSDTTCDTCKSSVMSCATGSCSQEILACVSQGTGGGGGAGGSGGGAGGAGGSSS